MEIFPLLINHGHKTIVVSTDSNRVHCYKDNSPTVLGILHCFLDFQAHFVLSAVKDHLNKKFRHEFLHEEFVSYLRYPPHGQRSWGPTRANFAFSGYDKEEANASILAFAMIETADALKNLDEIAATPHLDALYIGPSDLSIGMSNGALKPGLDREEPEVIEVLQHIAATAKKHRIRAVLHCGSPDYATRGLEWGFDMFTIAADSALLAQSAAAAVSKVRKALG